jgi:hypothetical protein
VRAKLWLGWDAQATIGAQRFFVHLAALDRLQQASPRQRAKFVEVPP